MLFLKTLKEYIIIYNIFKIFFTKLFTIISLYDIIDYSERINIVEVKKMIYNKIIKRNFNYKTLLEYLEKPASKGYFSNSVQNDYSFTKTNTFEEAVELYKNGWEEIAQKLVEKIDIPQINSSVKTRMNYNVVGFQASVPRYLQGIPTSMIDKKNVIQKQKVITVVKHIGYLSSVSTDTIIENSIKALKIIQALEQKGYRVNLDVISPANEIKYKQNFYTKNTETYREAIVVRIRVKEANERLNISKVAFPLVHPSMLRRIIFRIREIETEKKADWLGMGSSIYDREEVKNFLEKGELYLHNFIDDINKEVENMVKQINL